MSDDYDVTDEVGQVLLEDKFNEPKIMKNGIFKLDKANIKSAIVYGLVTMAVVFILSAAESVLKAGTIFGIDWKHVVDVATLAAVSIFVASVSVIKNMLTTNAGNFLGIAKVVSDTE